MKRKTLTSIAATLLISGLTTTSLAITDIEDHWSKDVVNQLVSENVIDGFSDGTFKPDQEITREETAKIAALYFNDLIVDKDIESTLSDIEGRWSEDNIQKLVRADIIKGYPDGSFNPEGNIKRSEVAAIAYKALENSNQYVDKNIESEFSDIDDNWAKDYINSLVKMGIVNGYEDGSFKPDNNITRAEVASIFSKMNIDYYLRNESEALDIESHWAENVMDDYSDYYEFSIESSDTSEKILLSAKEKVTDLKLMKIEYVDDDNDGEYNFSEKETLYSLDSLTKEKPLVIELTFPGTIPNYGVSFVDKDGNTKHYAISISGKDGSVQLNEYTVE